MAVDKCETPSLEKYEHGDDRRSMGGDIPRHLLYCITAPCAAGFTPDSHSSSAVQDIAVCWEKWQGSPDAANEKYCMLVSFVSTVDVFVL